MGIARMVLRTLTWWHGATLNTQFFTWRKGIRVGQDAQGNVFYRTRDDRRRWVIFNGEAEASRITPDWHGWLHHTFDKPPDVQPLVQRPWQKPHQQNLTGSAQAYVPAGSIRPAAPPQRQEHRDYEAWRPD
ncbi:MAG: NADH:ubiquinone oxidoreductase subunit NDUFA12 [Rhodobacteraceae bacterium]|nr:NADH:ubiquinone oxidoreductase subunit NDUFA12 [Paracoccaceae bacterium]